MEKLEGVITLRVNLGQVSKREIKIRAWKLYNGDISWYLRWDGLEMDSIKI